MIKDSQRGCETGGGTKTGPKWEAGRAITPSEHFFLWLHDSEDGSTNGSGCPHKRRPKHIVKSE